MNKATIRDIEKDRANPEAYILKRASWAAKQKRKEFNLTLEDIQIPEFCPILGVKLAQVRTNPRDFVPSLDRIDNSKGYVKGNVRVISFKANVIKSILSLETIRNLYDYVKPILKLSASD